MKRKGLLTWVLILCTVVCMLSFVSDTQTVYASSLSKKEKEAYMKVIDEEKREYIKNHSSKLYDKALGFADFREIINYTFIDIDMDGKKEMLVKTYSDQDGGAQEDCYVYKYSNGKVKRKLEPTDFADSGFCFWPGIGLTSKYLLFRSGERVYKFDRKTFKLISCEELTSDYNSDEIYVDDNGLFQFKAGVKEIILKSNQEPIVTLGNTDKKAYKIYEGDSVTIGKGTGTWYSSNKKVATVDKHGKIIGKKTGTVYIYKKTGKNTVACYLLKVKKKEELKDGMYMVLGSYGKISGNQYTVTEKVYLEDGTNKTYLATKRVFPIATNCKYGHIDGEGFHACSKSTFMKEYISMPDMVFHFQLKNGKIVKFAMSA